MTSTAQILSTLKSKLEALECHFTWDLYASRSRLFHMRDALEDIGTKEGYSWLGHIYNLQGFIHHQLGFIQEALTFFCRATETFRQIRNTVSDEGPWLVVNYGNLAWMHHLLGEPAQSRDYLSKVHDLISEYPSPCQDELHPEICAEKAWTLMKFDKNKQMLATDYFQRAVRMQPDTVEWQTNRALALLNASRHHTENLGPNILEKMKIAKEHDPDNLHLAALYLDACPGRGIKMQDEVRELARKVLRKPVSSYSGIEPLLRLYRRHLSMDEAIDLAEEALERHPEARYIKKCAVVCYRMKIFAQSNNPDRSMIDRAVSLCEEVITLYPYSSLKMHITLAEIYSKLNQAKADLIFEELLKTDLDPEGAQMLYSCYAKHVGQKDMHKSLEYHMKAAAIPTESFYRKDSIRNIRKIRDRSSDRLCGEIEEFLDKVLQ
ncbi:interferon-induced protein with tetratricopeptide repeats 2-like [Cololabis saira]|uniref:interferon-induced protein with tetratricopeptide repeats 2-like n=1 Tax=Cololabis saira TaxID=129043 RepID=UPI002AD3680F|nr:interferon-induced protein with tetratricopeptide repeats 2-like [Cololabis saira]